MQQMHKEGDVVRFIGNGADVRVRVIEARVARTGIEYSVIPTQGQPETFWAKDYHLTKAVQ